MHTLVLYCMHSCKPPPSVCTTVLYIVYSEHYELALYKISFYKPVNYVVFFSFQGTCSLHGIADVTKANVFTSFQPTYLHGAPAAAITRCVKCSGVELICLFFFKLFHYFIALNRFLKFGITVFSCVSAPCKSHAILC